jgi:GcrA cell cycle regulator
MSRWRATPEGIELIRHEWESGARAEDIAAKLGCHYRTVWDWVARLKLRRARRLPCSQEERRWLADGRVVLLRRLWDQGLPAREIAERLGVSRGAVIGKAWRMDLDPRASGPHYEPPVYAIAAVAYDGCVWPIGDPPRFCGAPVARAGASYCSEHNARATMKEKGNVSLGI